MKLSVLTIAVMGSLLQMNRGRKTVNGYLVIGAPTARATRL